MAARTPRRSFATPFVITLAAAPACYVQSSPPPQQPQPQPMQPQPVTQGPQQPPPVITNPPMPEPAPKVPANQRWDVSKAADGSCMAAEDVTCKAGATCNPPPPFKYACPPNVTIPPSIVVVSNADGTACQVEQPPMKCPPNVACNPPRPQPVACPKR